MGKHISITVKVLGLLIPAILIFISCHGGVGTGNVSIQPTPLAPGGGNFETGDPSMPAGSFPVRVRPQEAQAFEFRGTSFTEATSLAAQLESLRGVSYTAGDLIKSGSQYEPALPIENATKAGLAVTFHPTWEHTGSGSGTDMAYCMYRFHLDGYDQLPTIRFDWQNDIPPAPTGKNDNFWVGLGNHATGTWNWYIGPVYDNVLTLDTFAPYYGGDEYVIVAIVLLGTTEYTLDQLQVGAAETRTGGDIGMDGSEEDNNPPLDGGGGLPDSVDLSPGCSPVRNQGWWASCTAFAVGDGAFNYELGKLYGNDGWDFDDLFNMVSPKYLYVESGKQQGLPWGPYYGRHTNQVGNGLVSSGIATEQNAPYNMVYDDSWSSEALADAALLHTESWTSIDPAAPAGLQSVKAVLALQERPLVMRTGFDQGYADYESGVWNFTGPSIGGHAMLVVGYDDGLNACKVRNSYGDEWGESGYLWISYDTFSNSEAAVWCWYLTAEYDPAVVNRFLGFVPELPPPTGVQASDGTYTDRIRVQWDPMDGATGYRVYRDTRDNQVANLGNVTQWDDTTLTDFNSHSYWVRQTDGTGLSNHSTSDTGFRSQAPGELQPPGQLAASDGTSGDHVAVSWTHPAGPTPEGYDIYRAAANHFYGATPVGSVVYPALQYLDTGAIPGGTYYYMVKSTANGFADSGFSNEDTGWRGGDPPELGAWRMYGHDPQHTGRSPYVGPHEENVLWSYTTGGNVDSSPAIGTDGTIYVGSGDKSLYAINPDGTLRWSYNIGDYLRSPAIGADGTVYVGSLDNKLHAINPDGSFKWSYATGGDVGSPVIGVGDTVYVGSMDNMLHAINPDGTLLWSYRTGGDVGYPTIGVDGTIYIGSEDNKLHAINPDGTLRWSYTTGGGVGSPAIGADGTIYVGSVDKNLYAINPDGTLRWSYTTGYRIGSPVIGADGTLYVGSYDHLGAALYAVNPNGTFRWLVHLGGDVNSPAIGADGTLYVGIYNDSNAEFHAINPDGSILWSYRIWDWMPFPPAIGADGTVYVGSYSDKLYAFGPGASVLSPPAGLDASNGTFTDRVRVTWAHQDRDLQPDGYNIYRSETRSGTYTLIGDAGYSTQYDDLTADSSQMYWYRASGYKSGYSESVQGTKDNGCRMGAIEPGDWCMFGREKTRNRLSGKVGPIDNDLLWSLLPDGGISGSAVQTAGGITLIGGNNGYLYALANDGIGLWSFDTGAPVVSSPALTAECTIIAGNTGGDICGLSFDGDELWRYTAGGAIHTSPAVDSSDNVFFGSLDNFLYKLDSGGNMVWRFNTGHEIYSSPALAADGSIYFGCEGNKFWALNADGTEKWSAVTGGAVRSSPAIGSDGTVYVGTNTVNKVFAFDPDTGATDWEPVLGGNVESSPAIDADGNIIVGCDDGYLYKLDKTDGSTIWMSNANGAIKSSPAISANGIIHFGSDCGLLYAVNGDGNEMWRYNTVLAIHSSPCIGQDGSIVFAGAGEVFAIGPGGG